jgi:hypothetical protein
VTGYTLEGDRDLQRLFGSGFLMPHYPQTVLEEVGAVYSRLAPNDPYVIVDGKLVTGQNQQSASEYALALLHEIDGRSRSWLLDVGASGEGTSRSGRRFGRRRGEIACYSMSIWMFVSLPGPIPRRSNS